MLTLSNLLWAADAYAQDSTNEPASPTLAEEAGTAAELEPTLDEKTSATPLPEKPWQAREAARPAAPDVYLLPDESGKLRKVLGFRYEDFLEAWKRDERDGLVAPPRYVLDAWNVTGTVSETHAHLRIEFQITVQAALWIEVPLQLPGFVVQQLQIEGQVDGECLVFDKQRHGHVIWLSSQAGRKRKIVFEGLAKVKRSSSSYGLELYLPRATSSQFALHVPDSFSSFESSPEMDISAVDLKTGTTEVRLLGQDNPIRLNWSHAEEGTSNQSPLVEVEGQTTVELNRRRVFYDATLKINSYGDPLEQILVRLPLHAILSLGENSAEYEIKESPGAATNEDQRVVVEVRPSAPRVQPWEFHLSAERPLEPFSGSAEFDVEGFEVLNAARQSGVVTLEVDDQLQSYFDTHGDIDQTRLRTFGSAAEGRSILGQFRYTRFPWQLTVHTSPRQRRVSVTPKVNLTLESEEALLDIEYDYQLTGAQIFSLRVNLHGWKLSDAPIESGGRVDLNGVVETREGTLVLPLVDAGVQQLRLNLSLRKDLQLGVTTFPLPEPLGTFVVDGELLVNSVEALRVTPMFDEIAGLSVISNAEENPPDLDDQDATANPNQIRLRTFSPQPKFVAEVRQRQRQVNATIQTLVEVDQQTIRVRQRINYEAKYGPVSVLAMSLPELLWLNDSLTVTLAGEPLAFGLGTSIDDEPIDHQESETTGEDVPLRQMIVSLPRPMQSGILIEIAYELPAPKYFAEELTPVLLPLASPGDSVIVHEAVVSPTQPVVVTANQDSGSGDWNILAEENASNGAAGKLRLQTNESVSFLSLYAQIDSTDEVQLATLERAWIQSWMAAGRRQERAVFRFRSANATVYTQLPPELETTELEVLLDGNPWPNELDANNRLTIAMPTEGQRDSHTMELRYQSTASLPSWGRIQTSLPRLECRPASAPIYWQLILPRSWQVVTSPAQLIPDYWLGWKNYQWGRQPNLSQADLEQITVAISSTEPTPLSAQYVYRALEIPNEIQVVVVQKVWLLMAGALATFGIGLLWLYTRLVRSGALWLGLALVLLIGVYSYPEVTLLAIQIILAGGLMTFAAGVLRRVFIDKVNPQVAATRISAESSIAATEPWQQQPMDLDHATSETTATLPAGGPSS